MKKILLIAAAIFCLAIGHPSAFGQDAGVNGKWHFVLATPGGDREMNADLAVDADGNVTGKWDNADVAGTYKDGKLALHFPYTSAEAGTTAEVKIEGKLDESSAIVGNWEFSEYNGTFKATRPAADTAPAAKPEPQ